MFRITRWVPLEQSIDSEYGEISLIDWCKKEIPRLKKRNKFDFVIIYRDGRQCTYPNKEEVAIWRL